MAVTRRYLRVIIAALLVVGAAITIARRDWLSERGLWPWPTTAHLPDSSRKEFSAFPAAVIEDRPAVALPRRTAAQRSVA